MRSNRDHERTYNTPWKRALVLLWRFELNPLTPWFSESTPSQLTMEWKLSARYLVVTHVAMIGKIIMNNIIVTQGPNFMTSGMCRDMMCWIEASSFTRIYIADYTKTRTATTWRSYSRHLRPHCGWTGAQKYKSTGAFNDNGCSFKSCRKGRVTIGYLIRTNSLDTSPSFRWNRTV